MLLVLGLWLVLEKLVNSVKLVRYSGLLWTFRKYEKS